MRDLHNAVAHSADPAEASTRPPDTLDFELRAMYRDVVRKLRLTGRERVLEIGCGVGLLAPHIAKHCAEYVGIDFAPEAIAVARQRVRDARAGDHCSFAVVDVLDGPDAAVARFAGRFDRVLAYAVLHYARNDADGRRFVRVAVRSLRPDGLVLFGNLPVEDVRADVRGSWLIRRGRVSRLMACARWVARGNDPFGRSVAWKAAAAVVFFAKAALRRVRAPRGYAPATLPPGYCLELTTQLVERWVAVEAPGRRAHWLAPSPIAPLSLNRADLVVG